VLWQGDITDLESLVRCCRGALPETIYHLAGDTSARDFDGDWKEAERVARVNFWGTLNIVRAAANASPPPRVLVRAGGLEEYGAGPVPYIESQREMPRSPYSASQVAATHWCQMLQPHLAFTLLTLRPTLVYGPAQSSDFLIPAVIRSLLLRRRFSLTAGLQRRDLLYVDDFVSAALAAGRGEHLRGAVINIASGQGLAVRDLARQIAKELNAEALLDFGAVPSRMADIEDLVARNSEAERLLQWRPTVSLEDGLCKTIDWYRRELL